MKHDPETERKITSLAARLLVAFWGMPEDAADNVPEPSGVWEKRTIRRMFEVAEIFNAECERRKAQ